jgi:murein DD-endopeptidase MepM/ murein hydrolase activator NlpD
MLNKKQSAGKLGTSNRMKPHFFQWYRFVFLTAGLISACAILPTQRLSVEGILESSSGRESLLFGEQDVPAKTARGVASVPYLPLQWPLRQMKLSSGFGRRGGSRHDGIDLQSKWGTPIYAAADGVVVYAGNEINGYGETIVLRHRGDLATLYAHASELLVQDGQRVERGQAIGYVGDTGNATGPHLHFEIRVGKKPIDPWNHLSVPRRLNLPSLEKQAKI